MKIALIVPGGVDRSGTHRVIPCLLWLMERLTAAGVDLHVFAVSQEPDPGTWTLHGAVVHNAGRRARRLRTTQAVIREHRRAPFDLIHAVWAAPSGVVAAAAKPFLRLPVLLHVTGGDLASIPAIEYGARLHWRGRMKVRVAVAAADRVTVPSAFVAEQARELGIEAERVTYGVALDRWPPLPPRPRSSERPVRILSVGTLNRVKDPDMLLRLCARLRRRGYDFRFDVVGEDLLSGCLQSRAAAEGFEDRIRFHGFLPHETLRPLVEAADLLVVCSRHEADPVALLEAAVAGVPAVGTSVGHLAEWAPDACVSVPVGDERALASSVMRLIDHDDERLALARRAQQRAVAFDADRAAGCVIRAYVELARAPRREPARARLDWRRWLGIGTPGC